MSTEHEDARHVESDEMRRLYMIREIGVALQTNWRSLSTGQIEYLHVLLRQWMRPNEEANT